MKSTVSKIVAAAFAVLMLGACGKKAGDTAISAVPAGTGTVTEDARIVLARDLDAAAFSAALGSPGSILVDVRTVSEYASGHVEGAMNIDVNGPDFLGKVGTLPKEGQILLYCRSGNRSSLALDKMKKAGFGQVSHLSGGVGAWTAAGKSLIR
jgi:rhodanese-related sulfurtransferase